MTEYTFTLSQLYEFEASAFEKRKLHNKLGQVTRAAIVLNAAKDAGLLAEVSDVDQYINDNGVAESIEDANEIMKAYYKAVTPGKKK